MSEKFKFRPNVPGQMGKKTISDFSIEPPIVSHLHFIFDYYPDDIFTSFPALVVSESLWDKINEFELSGLKNPKMIIYNKSREYFGDQVTKQKYFMVEVSTNINCDFCNYPNLRGDFIVSLRALNLLKSFRIEFAKIENFNML
jgi:hypothetical protein